MASNACYFVYQNVRIVLAMLVGADESDEGVTLVERLDVVLASVESQKTAHETHVVQTETKLTEMLADMNKLSDVMRERVSNLESIRIAGCEEGLPWSLRRIRDSCKVP